MMSMLGGIRRACLSVAALAVILVPARAEVVIGIAGPMGGSFADVGRDIKAGVEIAVATANARGGIGGEKIRTVAVDDKCEAETAAAVANQLIGKGVRAVIGHACTAAALPAARVYADAGVLFLSPAATNPRFTDEKVGDGVFRLTIRSDRQGRAIADYLKARFDGKRVAFVHDGSVYGQGLVEQAAKLFADQGGAVAMTERFTPGEKSQNNLIGKIQDAAVSAVVMGALQADAAVIAGEMRARGLDAALIGNESLALSEFKALAGDAAEGTVFFLPFVDKSLPQAVGLLLSLEERQLMPTDTVFTAHAATEAAIAALNAGGDLAAQAEFLRGSGANTVLGKVTFDAKGDWSGGTYESYVWRGDTFALLPQD
ncbi:branched-chain amino acid ABC transporter substrate-binding protein [Pleomorphomonas sp. NRK KF1]|uniref:branched-chain amino acid ABC transporter substrate-binding protein n=1 Tax=Pleomorphomonas sp. NRK KF1 TaxID=2943000 RepID=UPI002042CACF|nr:branched-chain amino acid ABC transporter substrate-binding protein [Pleomorphomonas sp. NRK KF1]MCM5555705.1 branched-chain amino acid ABC transporter substrate-binding protein [Pleomorphomonas sp. NRK KF1]